MSKALIAAAIAGLGLAESSVIASAVRGDVVTLVTDQGQKLVFDPANPPKESPEGASPSAATAEEGAGKAMPAPTEAEIQAAVQKFGIEGVISAAVLDVPIASIFATAFRDPVVTIVTDQGQKLVCDPRDEAMKVKFVALDEAGVIDRIMSAQSEFPDLGTAENLSDSANKEGAGEALAPNAPEPNTQAAEGNVSAATSGVSAPEAGSPTAPTVAETPVTPPSGEAAADKGKAKSKKAAQ